MAAPPIWTPPCSRDALGRRGGRACAAAVAAQSGRQVEKALQQVQWQRKNDSAVLLGGDLGQRLQIPQLQRGRLAANDLRGVGQLLAGAELAFRVDDLGALFAFSFSL